MEQTNLLVYDDHSSPIVHVVKTNGRIGGKVFHVAIGGDAMSATILELGEKVLGDNRRDLLCKCVDCLKGI